jgi:hypothetical protein
MPVIITGNNTPTAGGITYGDGSTYANTAAGTSGQPVVSGGAGAPVFRPYTLPATDGSASQVLQTNGSGVLSFATPSSGYTLGTPVVTTSGTIISFTGIPAGVKQVVVNFKNVSSNSTGNLSIQLGTSAGIRTTGYNSSALNINNTPTVSTDTSSTLFVITGSKPAAEFLWGSVTLTLENSTNNTWVSSGVLTTDFVRANMSAGYVDLPGVLTQLRIQSLGDTFDSGEINIAYI